MSTIEDANNGPLDRKIIDNEPLLGDKIKAVPVPSSPPPSSFPSTHNDMKRDRLPPDINTNNQHVRHNTGSNRQGNATTSNTGSNRPTPPSNTNSLPTSKTSTGSHRPTNFTTLLTNNGSNRPISTSTRKKIPGKSRRKKLKTKENNDYNNHQTPTSHIIDNNSINQKKPVEALPPISKNNINNNDTVEAKPPASDDINSITSPSTSTNTDN